MSHLKISGARKVTWNKFGTEDPLKLGAAVQNSAPVTYAPLFVVKNQFFFFTRVDFESFARDVSWFIILWDKNGNDKWALRCDRFIPKRKAPNIHWIGGFVEPGAYVYVPCREANSVYQETSPLRFPRPSVGLFHVEHFFRVSLCEVRVNCSKCVESNDTLRLVLPRE
jgi:hypothetical protein